jgi:protein-S-isoprenylcysteine O-methyltransferase Ste14
MAATDVATRLTVVRIGTTILHLVVGGLFLVRKPLAHNGDLRGVLLCLPSLVVCGIAFKLAPPANVWPVASQVTFAAGTVLAVVSSIYLGRCFAVLPAVRGVVSNGPYRIVRHPVYAGEFLMILGCFLSDPQPLHIAPLAAAVPLLVVRIRVEERLLQGEPAYREYADSVQWRLLPGVW